MLYFFDPDYTTQLHQNAGRNWISPSKCTRSHCIGWIENATKNCPVANTPPYIASNTWFVSRKFSFFSIKLQHATHISAASFLPQRCLSPTYYSRQSRLVYSVSFSAWWRRITRARFYRGYKPDCQLTNRQTVNSFPAASGLEKNVALLDFSLFQRRALFSVIPWRRLGLATITSNKHSKGQCASRLCTLKEIKSKRVFGASDENVWTL